MKESVRRMAREERDGRLEPELAVKSAAILERLFACSEYKRAKAVMFYVSTGREVDTLPAIRRALGEKTVAVPFVQGGEIVPVRINGMDELVPGSFGVLEPRREAVDGNRVEPREIDLVVVPGVAFDGKGNRVGYGKGYYDKFLKKTRGAAAVALAYEFQVLQSVPVEEHDVVVGKIITEKREIKA
ncbi:MAG: 5-formyltetrahydrofolate cyclo-ligase [Candidatus Micrarchaeota archaeon]|nr:5-formyltetrahydrofolate cyclo-ligase [Candidatus Micrarchaeota archaeon]